MIIGASDISKMGQVTIIYGPSGTGKTVLAGQAGGLYIDVEGGQRSMLEPRPHIVKPENFSELTEIIAAITNIMNSPKREVIIRGQKICDLTDNPTITIDTIDGLSDVARKNVLGGKEIMKGFDDWNLLIARTENPIKFFIDLRDKGFNIILIAHEEYEKSDLTSIVKGQPNLPGKDTAERICAKADTVLHMVVRQTAEGDQRAVVSQPDGVFFAKDRTWKLSKYTTGKTPQELAHNVWNKLHDKKPVPSTPSSSQA